MPVSQKLSDRDCFWNCSELLHFINYTCHKRALPVSGVAIVRYWSSDISNFYGGFKASVLTFQFFSKALAKISFFSIPLISTTTTFGFFTVILTRNTLR